MTPNAPPTKLRAASWLHRKPRHDDIALSVGSEQKDVLTDLDEPKLPVEGNRLRIAFPYTKPYAVRPTRTHFTQASVHEVMRDTLAVELADYVQSLDLAGSMRHNASGRLAPTKLSESYRRSTLLAKQSDNIRVGNLHGLYRLPIGISTVEVNVFRGIQPGKGVPERRVGNCCKRLGVLAMSSSYD